MHVVIVGAYGSAGVAAADGLIDRVGDEIDRLTLIDGGDPGGGLCILRGCMPSKELLSAAAHRYQARRDDRLGDPPAIDLDGVIETKDRHVENFAEHRRAAVRGMAERDGVEFEAESARFVGDRTVAVGDRTIEADYVVIATGSTVNPPDLPGIDDVSPRTSADVLDSTAFPDSGVVMGFGYVGVELIPYLAEAGEMELTVIEHGERPLDFADPAYGDALLDLYREEFGIEILTETEERSVERTGDGGVRLELERDGEREAVAADALFAFTGRRPNLDGLELENASLEPEEGWVEDTMRARDDPRTFVVGDANGREPILHAAKEQGRVAASNVLAHARSEDLRRYENVTQRVVFAGASVYPYARVGHTEASADDAGREYVAVTREASEHGVFEIRAVPRGRATLVVDRDGTVLGYQGLHHHADAMAKTVQVAIERGMDVRELPSRAYHPTTPELLDGLFRDAKRELR